VAARHKQAQEWERRRRLAVPKHAAAVAAARCMRREPREARHERVRLHVVHRHQRQRRRAADCARLAHADVQAQAEARPHGHRDGGQVVLRQAGAREGVCNDAVDGGGVRLGRERGVHPAVGRVDGGLARNRLAQDAAVACYHGRCSVVAAAFNAKHQQRLRQIVMAGVSCGGTRSSTVAVHGCRPSVQARERLRGCGSWWHAVSET
jgi:hypothetical protein